MRVPDAGGAQKSTAFVWTKARERAASLLAADRLSDEEIAADLRISRTNLAQWKRRPEFQARVQEHVAAYRRLLIARGVANRQYRIDALNDLVDRLRDVIAARAADPRMADVPGGPTGLLTRTLKSIGFGDNNQTVVEVAVDTGTLKELREYLKQGAQEVGQWTEHHDLTTGGKAVRFTLRIDRGADGDDAED